MIGKMVIFAFSLLGMFALLMGNMPPAFMANQQAWNPSYYGTDHNVVKFFDAHNITVYSNSASGTLMFPQTGSSGEKDKVGLPSNEQLSFEWGWYRNRLKRGSVETPDSFKALWISHEMQHNFLGILYWWTNTYLTLYTSNGVNRGDKVGHDEVVADFTESLNGTYYHAQDNTVQVSVLYSPNSSITMSQAWDNGVLNKMVSYSFNASASSVNMWTVLTNLITFKSPNLGLPSPFGDWLNTLIALPLSVLIAYLVFKFLSGIVPFFSGGSGD